MRRFRSLIVAAGATAMLAAGGGIAAWASWSTGGNSAPITARSASIPVMDPPRVKLIGGTPRISWPPIHIMPGEPVDGYVVTRIDGASRELVCTTSARSCDDDAATAGSTVTYVVRATLGAHWVGVNSEPSDEVEIPGLAAAAAPADKPPADTAKPPAGTKKTPDAPQADPTPSASTAEPTPSATTPGATTPAPTAPAPTSADPTEEALS